MSSRPRVLIVDDVPDWRDLLAGRLRRDCDVEGAGSLPEALNILMSSENLFHLVVLDLSLKGAATDQQGLEIAQYIRTSSSVTSIIIITAYPDIASARQAFWNFRADNYLEKTPTKGAFSLDEFERAARDAIDAALERHKDAFVFVVMPFKREFTNLYDRIIKPTIKEEGMIPLRADDFFEPRRIMESVERAIGEAGLIVADLSDRNPNVFYEVGMAHTLGKPTILLTQDLRQVPPRLRDIRCIPYEDSYLGGIALREQLCKTIQSIRKSGIKQEVFFSLPERPIQVNPSLCFILKPSPDVKDQIYEPVVRPLLVQLGLQGITPDRVFTVKHELDEIWHTLNEARFAIADLTGKDPEVFYLAGVCRGLGKEVVFVAQSDEDIPFDLKGPSRIIYALKPYYKGEEARQALEEVLSQYSPHAPSGRPTF